MADDHHRLAAPRELRDHLHHFPRHRRVEGARRLVEEHHPRAHRQRPGDCDPLLLPTGERHRPGRLEPLHADPRQQRRRKIGGVGPRPSEHDPRREHDVLEHREVRKQVELLEHHADVPAEPHEVAGPPRRARRENVAGDEDLARVERLEGVQAPQERALPAPRGADDRGHLPLANLEIDVGERRDAAAELSHRTHADHGVASRPCSNRRDRIDSGQLIRR